MFETTVTVVFNDGEDNDHIILAELDDVLNVDSDGEVISTFAPGDEPYIRFNASDNVTIDSVVATDGGVLSLGNVSRTIELEQLFASNDAAEPDELSFSVVVDTVDVSYIGRDGSFTTKDLGNGMLKYVGDIASVPFLMAATIDYTAKSYQLIPPTLNLDEEETYNIYVVFYVTVTE